ncbi:MULTISPECIES: hypothetical protein [Bacillus]|uniref:hypothetical protein n=1 Tax=Bacillus TaxID=1386 RepID=UPI0028F7F42E|nr:MULTISPECIES: hypothetical protein [Bacillus]MDU0072091.1 hypothetical protein [Bacillus sp. IG6]MED8019650.1 hypothetical protein [Bacillus glycinifermentans]
MKRKLILTSSILIITIATFIIYKHYNQTNSEETYNQDEIIQPNPVVDLNSNEPKDETDEYDVYAYRLDTREISERNGAKEYVYGGDALDRSEAEVYGYKTTPIKNEEEQSFKFWRFDVDFVPEEGDIILVKYPRGNHKEYTDIQVIYDPIGDQSRDIDW